MSVLNRPMFAKSYAEGGEVKATPVEDKDIDPALETAKGWLQYKGEDITLESLSKAYDYAKEALSDTFWFDIKENTEGRTERPEPDPKPDRPIYRPPPPPNAVQPPVREDDFLSRLTAGGTVNRYTPSAGISSIPIPNADNYQRKTESFDKFAKDIGVDLSDPYTPWDYISDLSAGLLASNDNTFLGALGDAALLSNKNKRASESQQKDLKAKLAMAKYQNDNAWDIARYKADSKWSSDALTNLKGTNIKLSTTGMPSITDEGGKTHQLVQITEGADQLAANGAPIFNYNGVPVMYKRDMDEYKLEQRVHTRHQKQVTGITNFMSKPEVYDKAVKNELRKHMYKGNLLWGATKSDEYIDALQQARDAGLEGIEQFAEAVEDGRGQDAYYFLQSAEGAPRLMKALKSATEEGLWTTLSEGEEGRFNELIQEEASRLALEAVGKNQTKSYDPVKFVRQAMRNVIPKINWDIQGEGKWNLDITEAEHVAGQEITGDIVGKDLIGSIFNTDLFDKAEWPKDDPRSGAVLQLENELAMFNKNQYSLLSDYDKGVLASDVAEFSRKIAQATGIDTETATNDLWSSMLTKDVVSGGEDIPGGTNLPAKYRPFKTWKVEPAARRQQARDNGFLWDHERGVWWKPGTAIIKEPEVKPNEIEL